MKNNIDREGVNKHKIRWFKECRKGNIGSKITARYSKFSEFSISDIQSKFSGKIEGILLDVDDCIAPAYGDILEENIQKINEILNSGIKIGILSNGQKIEERINKIQEKVGNRLQICNTGTKPEPQSFLKACEQLQIAPENTVMVGDDIGIDGGALQLNKDEKQLLGGFVHIEPIGNSYFKIPMHKIPNYIGKNICRGYINKKNR